MTEYFCVYCGIRTKNNTLWAGLQNDKHFEMSCPQCGTEIIFDVKTRPTKTFTEAQQEFLSTPLTDSQRGTKRHSSPKRT